MKSIMKRRATTALLLVFALLCGCTPSGVNVSTNGFFIWMDGYCAAEVGTSHAIAWSFYDHRKNPAINPEDIIAVDFDDIAQDVVVSDFSISDLELEDKAYQGFGLSLNIAFHKEGVYKTNQLVLSLKNNHSYAFPIGSFVFDIGEKENEELLNTWSSPAVTSNAENFAYDFNITQENAKITAITYGEDNRIQNPDGIDPIGMIPLSDAYRSPVKYIKPKMELVYQGTTQVVYSNVGCYCGASGFSDDIIAQSKEYSLRNQQKNAVTTNLSSGRTQEAEQ